MKITVLGANGRTGVEVVKQALATGHTVYGVMRHAGTLESGPNLHIVIGDATDANVIAQASKDSDVIISTLGTASNRSHLMMKTANAVIAASETTGCKRYIIMSAFTVKTGRLNRVIRLMSGAMRGMVEDKAESERIVRNSNLDWTIVYPTILTSRPRGSGLRIVAETERLGMKHKVSRADVAAFMLEEAESGAHVRQEVIISS